MESKHAGPTQQQREIAWLLGINPKELAEGVALNSRSGGLQAIPPGVATQPKTVTGDLVSDVASLDDVGWLLGIDPKELARRLASKKTHDESTHQTLKVGRDGGLTALNVAEEAGVNGGTYTESCVNRVQ